MGTAAQNYAVDQRPVLSDRQRNFALAINLGSNSAFRHKHWL